MSEFKIILSLLVIVIVGCKEGSYQIEEPSFTQRNIQKDLKFENIELDTILLKEFETSGQGISIVHQNNILFYDQYFRDISLFDSSGNFIKKAVDIGKGPKEVDNLWVFNDLPNGEILVIGGNLGFLFLDNNFEKKTSWIPITFEGDAQQQDQFNDISLYHPDYINELLTPGIFSNRYLILPITIRTHQVNAYSKKSNADQYYARSKTLAAVDIQSGVVEKIFGLRPNIYKTKKYLSYLDVLNYYISENKLYVSYAADPLIYVYDTKLNPLYSFGTKGKNIINHYPEVKTLQEFEEKSDSLRMNLGYYWTIFKDHENDLLFRSYQKKSAIKNYGLQIYNNDVKLIADIEVPPRFMVKGKIGQFYYADGYYYNDENTAIVGVYKFKLNEI